MKISIITVVLNGEWTIKDSIESVINQDYQNIELIIIDGGSLDRTIAIAKSYNKYLSALISEPDKGIYDAMNKGLKIATGEIIGFLNSDDYYANNHIISKVVKEFKSDITMDACYSDLIYVDRHDTSKTIRYFKSNQFKKGSFSKGWCPPHPTFFVRQSVYQRLGVFDLNYHIASDVDLMMRFLEIYKIKSHYIPEVFVKMRMGGTTNKSLKNIWQQNREILNSLNKNGLSVNVLKFFIYKIISRLIQILNK